LHVSRLTKLLRQSEREHESKNKESDCSNQKGRATQIATQGGFCESVLPPTPTQSRNTHQQAKSDWKGTVKAVFEFAGIVAIFGTLGGLVFQICELVQSNKIVAKSVQVAQQQALVAQRQLDDSEAQQRAILKIEKFDFTKVGEIIASHGLLSSVIGQIHLAQNVLIKNYGSTAAVDIVGEGQFITGDELNKLVGITNSPKRWEAGKTREPHPRSGGQPIMPQETYTNTADMTVQIIGGSLYIEMWFSYRDIFGKPYVIGEAGTYFASNNNFSSDMIYPVRLSSGADGSQNTNH
jgi:hypothetical protein